jgi:hypothetical protein
MSWWYGVRQLEVGTGTSLMVRPSTCMPVDAIPPPVSANLAVMLCTPLTGAPEPNMALDGPALTIGATLSLRVRSAREMRTVAA